ncbi:MAG: hypothetical protein ABR955_15670 [Verrucomicrobiota bacterium]
MLTANVEQRLAALKSSTHINGIQHLFLLPLFSEANASGMVSSKNQGFQVSESRQKSRLIERIKSGDDWRSERPFLKSERT